MLGRGATKILFVRPLESDNYSIFLSLVISILDFDQSLSSTNQSVAPRFLVSPSQVQTSNGLGKRDTALSPTQLLACSKVSSLFASCTHRVHTDRYRRLDTLAICFIQAACLSELSVILLVKNLMPFRQDKQALLGVGSVIVVWSITGIIVNAVECGSPTPWDYFNGHCIDRVRVVILRLPRYCLKPANPISRAYG